MIFVYIGAIIVFVGIGITIFVISKKKEQKRLEKLSQEQPPVVIKNVTQDEPFKEKTAEQPLVTETEEKSQDATLSDLNADGLEDFSLDQDVQEEKVLEEDEDDEIDRRFAEYQKFLRENLDMDNEEESGEMDQDDPYENFDPSEFMDRSPDEVSEMINKMPQQMQEILFSNALGRKDIEDEGESSTEGEKSSK